MIDFEIKGFDEFERKSRELQKDVQELASRYPKVSELFLDDFMQENTSYKSIDEMLDASGFEINKQEDLQKIRGDERWNAFVNENTKFENWNEMLLNAYKKYIQRKLFK